MKRNFKREKLSSATDAELLSIVRKRLDIPIGRAKDITSIFVEAVRECIEKNGYCNIRRLGKFYIATRKKARIKNFNNVLITIPIMYQLKFKSADSLRRQINVKAKKDRDESIRSARNIS